MKDYKEKGLFCEYEYCIEEQPLEHGELSCPVWGHDCPGRIAKLKTCGKRISDIPEERMYKGKINDRGEAILMDIKKAVEFVHWATDSFYVSDTTKEESIKFIAEGNKVISLLKQGEADNKELKIVKEELKKYRQMLEDIRLECNDTLIEFPKSKITYSFNDIFKMFKQKYFPKEEASK